MALTRYKVVDTTVTPSTTAYADGDVVGGLLTFTLSGGASRGSILNKLMMVDDDNEGAALKLYVFDDQPSTIADNAAFTPTAADLRKAIGIIDIASGDYTTVNSLKVAQVSDINDIVTADVFYGYLVCSGSTPTYASGKTLYLRLFVLTE